MVLVAPIWRSQLWYPALLELLIDHPLILPDDPELLMDPFGNPPPLVVAGQLWLAIWKLSGTDTWQREFQEKLPNCWLLDRAPKQTLLHGKDGIAGVLKGKFMPHPDLHRVSDRIIQRGTTIMFDQYYQIGHLHDTQSH